ncbi:MAG: hypothetical protein AB7O45_07545 [Alphaproteobacteria bacterium]
MRRRGVVTLCALAAVVLLAGGCSLPQLQVVADDATMQVRASIARMGAAVDQSEGVMASYLKVAEAGVRDMDKTSSADERQAIAERVTAQLAILDAARRYRVDNGPELMTEKIVEALKRMVQTVKED